jgi:hypothetical protein
MGAEGENLKRFEVSRRSLPDGEVEVEIRGELDLSTAARLEAELDAASAEAEGAVIVDFSACGSSARERRCATCSRWSRSTTPPGSSSPTRWAEAPAPQPLGNANRSSAHSA